jgi:hypothetical protein
MTEPRKARAFRPVHLLLLLPFIAMLWPPFYNRVDPQLAGIPFFYWYQMLWVFITAAILWFVYRSERPGQR